MQSKAYPHLGETLYSATLPNGLQLRVLPKPGFRTRYAALDVHYGSAYRRFTLGGRSYDTPAGVAHFLEHKAFDLPDGDNALQLLSANGADPNAFTSTGDTCYFFQCAENFEENLRLLIHFVTTPCFTAETVEKERPIIGQEIQMYLDSPDSTVYENLLTQLYAHHPIRERVLGTPESLAEITADTLYDCFNAFYTPANMCLCVAGDVDPEEIEALAREAFPSERAEIPETDFGPAEELLPVEPLCRVQMPVAAPQYLIGAKLPLPASGAEAQRARITALLALRTLFGPSSAFYTRLYSEGIITRNYSYDVDFSAGTATFLLGGESRDPERVLAEFKRELAAAAESGLKSAQLERCRRAAFGARLRGLEDFESVCLSVADGVFDGYDALEAPVLLAQITKVECEAFLRGIRPEMLALSRVDPYTNT